MQYNSYKVRKLVGQRPITVVVKPRTALSVYKGAFTGYGMAPKNQWIDCANTDVQHYGLIGIFEGVSPSGSTTYKSYFRVECTYYLKFKGIR